MNSKVSAQLAIMTSGILMGFVGLFVNALDIIPTFAIVSLRGLFGTLILLLFLLFSKRIRVLWYVLRMSPGLIIGQSLAEVAVIFCYFLTIQTAGYAYAAFMLYTGPVFAAGFIALFLHNYPTRQTLIAFGLALLGLTFLVDLWAIIFGTIVFNQILVSTITGLLSGISLGLLSMLKVAFFQRLEEKNRTNSALDLQKFNKIMEFQNDRIAINLGITTFNVFFLFCVFGPFSFQYYPALNLSHWGIAFGLGLLPTAIAFTLFNIGLQQDKGGDVLIFSYSETIVGSFLTGFLDHALTWNLLIGGGLVITGNLLVALHKSKK